MVESDRRSRLLPKQKQLHRSGTEIKLLPRLVMRLLVQSLKRRGIFARRIARALMKAKKVIKVRVGVTRTEWSMYGRVTVIVLAREEMLLRP